MTAENAVYIPDYPRGLPGPVPSLAGVPPLARSAGTELKAGHLIKIQHITDSAPNYISYRYPRYDSKMWPECDGYDAQRWPKCFEYDTRCGRSVVGTTRWVAEVYSVRPNRWPEGTT